MTDISKTLADFTQFKIDQQASKLMLAERIEQQLLVTHNGGLFKATPELICFLTVWSDDVVYIPDSYNNPIKVSKSDLLMELKAAYQSAMNEWYNEYEQLKKQRRARDI
jgi:hypothetical protein